MDQFDEAAAARLGVGRTEFRCLDVLSRGTSVTPGQLAQDTGLSTGATTALVDRLEKGGFVRRKRDPNDRRRVLVQPTKRSIDEVWPLFAGLVTAAKRSISEFRMEELETILRFLERQRNVVHDHLPGKQPSRKTSTPS